MSADAKYVSASYWKDAKDKGRTGKSMFGT